MRKRIITTIIIIVIILSGTKLKTMRLIFGTLRYIVYRIIFYGYIYNAPKRPIRRRVGGRYSA